MVKNSAAGTTTQTNRFSMGEMPAGDIPQGFGSMTRPEGGDIPQGPGNMTRPEGGFNP
jgi:hypothetical protein